MEVFRRHKVDLLVRMSRIVACNDVIASVLRGNRSKFSLRLCKIIDALDGRRFVLADDKANDAGSDIVLREDIFLFPGWRLPDALRANRIFPRFNTNEEVIIRGRGEFPFVLGQLFRNSLHNGDFKAIGLALIIYKIIGHIVIRKGYIDDFLGPAFTSGAFIHLFAAARSKGHSPNETNCSKIFTKLTQLHFDFPFSFKKTYFAASRTHSKCFQSVSRGTVQSAPRMTPVRPAAARSLFVSAWISSFVPV